LSSGCFLPWSPGFAGQEVAGEELFEVLHERPLAERPGGAPFMATCLPPCQGVAVPSPAGRPEDVSP